MVSGPPKAMPLNKCSFPLPVALVVPLVDFDFGDPLDVLDAVEPGHYGAEWKAVHLRERDSVHHVGEQHVPPHSPFERDAVVVAVSGSKHDVAGHLRIGADFFQQLFKRDATPHGVAHAVAAGEVIDALKGGGAI